MFQALSKFLVTLSRPKFDTQLQSEKKIIFFCKHPKTYSYIFTYDSEKFILSEDFFACS